MVEYIRKRATGRVQFVLNTRNINEIYTMISPPLFDWVIENLLKNALDAMEGIYADPAREQPHWYRERNGVVTAHERPEGWGTFTASAKADA